jgi:6-phosphogluconolactonase
MKTFRSLLLLLAVVFLICGISSAAGKKYILYVGTYTGAESKGIYGFAYDAASGKVDPLGLMAKTDNPSFLTVDSANKFLYAVNEVHDYQDAASGGVTAFAMDRKSGALSELNEVASRGADPCYIAFDKTGKYLLIANYTGGNVAVIPVSLDGRLKDASSVLNDDGPLGPNKDRQSAPHAHWIEASARNRFAYVSDLGLDRVFIYKFDEASGSLTRGDPAKGSPSAGKDSFSATLAPGTGPRHVAFSLNGNFMYVLGELDSTVTVFANQAKQTYRSIQKISAIPASFSGLNEPAEIVLHPSGKFLYTSNRGDDSIAVFAVNGKSGKLRLVQRVSSGGKAPRHFAIDPLAKHLLAANEDSGNIVEFTIDPATGKLTTTGEIAKVASAVCLIFVPVD